MRKLTPPDCSTSLRRDAADLLGHHPAWLSRAIRWLDRHVNPLTVLAPGERCDDRDLCDGPVAGWSTPTISTGGRPACSWPTRDRGLRTRSRPDGRPVSSRSGQRRRGRHLLSCDCLMKSLLTLECGGATHSRRLFAWSAACAAWPGQNASSGRQRHRLKQILPRVRGEQVELRCVDAEPRRGSLRELARAVEPRDK